MGIKRYLGFHFTDTCIYIAEAYVGRDNHLHWDVLEQANYELEAEWLPVFKDAVPNLYDPEKQVYGFAALPSIWRGFRYDRFVRFDRTFFERIVVGKSTEADRKKLANLFRYCRTYHIRPQPDEELAVTLVVEGWNSRERRILQTEVERTAPETHLEFVDVIEPEEAALRYLWYESSRQSLKVEEQHLLLIYLGYHRTLIIPWERGELGNQSALAPGMVEVDRAVAMYAGKMGMGRTVGMDELLLYAQRTRRAFEPGQSAVKIVEAEVAAEAYLDIIGEQVREISGRLERFLRDARGRMKQQDQILLLGEGASFAPVVAALQTARVDAPMNTLPQPIYAAARGAAAKSWRSKNSDLEVR